MYSAVNRGDRNVSVTVVDIPPENDDYSGKKQISVLINPQLKYDYYVLLMRLISVTAFTVRTALFLCVMKRFIKFSVWGVLLFPG